MHLRRVCLFSLRNPGCECDISNFRETTYRVFYPEPKGSVAPWTSGDQRILNNLAGLLQDHGKYAETEPFLKNAWEILKRLLGADHNRSENVTAGHRFVLRTNGRNADHLSVLSQVNPRQSDRPKGEVNASIKADRKRRVS